MYVRIASNSTLQSRHCHRRSSCSNTDDNPFSFSRLNVSSIFGVTFCIYVNQCSVYVKNMILVFFMFVSLLLKISAAADLLYVHRSASPSRPCHTICETYSRIGETAPPYGIPDGHGTPHCSGSGIHPPAPDRQCRHSYSKSLDSSVLLPVLHEVLPIPCVLF